MRLITGLVNQFNEAYNKGEYFSAFQNVLTMQTKLNEYVAGKEQEAQARAQAEAEQAAAAAQVKNSSTTASSKNSGSSKSSGSSKNSGSSSSSGGSSEPSGSSDSSGSDNYDIANADAFTPGSVRHGMILFEENIQRLISEGKHGTYTNSYGETIQF